LRNPHLARKERGTAQEDAADLRDWASVNKSVSGPDFVEVLGDGRADVRLAVDQAGEMYVYSKSDGIIRRIVAATPTK
jgi:hypothetical protein